MPERITRRSLLVSALLLGQLACLLVALLWFGAWLERGLGDVVRDRILAASHQMTVQIVQMIQLMDIDDTAPGTPGWERMQKLVEDTKLPTGGYLSIVSDNGGRVLFHPDLKTRPELAQTTLDDILRTEVSPGASRLSRSGLASQWTLLSDDSYVLAAITIPKLKARMVIHQPGAPMRMAVMAFNEKVRTIGSVVVVVVVVISALVTMVIIRRYESRLSQINRGLEAQVAHRSAALLRSRDAVIFGLAKLAESRDGETGEHLERIAKYTEILARQVSKTQTPGGDEAWVQTLASTAVLHDIGKVGVPDAVLRKPSSLTPEEREIIEKHPFIGGDTLMEIKRRWGDDPFLVTASQVCFGHHERWDGTGYPFGLIAEHIPLAARIVALADVYDALTSERAYKDAMPHSQAKQMITDASGTQFDPMVVQAFIEVEPQFKDVAQQIKVSGNGRDPSLPAG
jgi:response regulator RpfG family c-di-GMP phosphodiesterase